MSETVPGSWTVMRRTPGLQNDAGGWRDHIPAKLWPRGQCLHAEDWMWTLPCSCPGPSPVTMVRLNAFPITTPCSILTISQAIGFLLLFFFLIFFLKDSKKLVLKKIWWIALIPYERNTLDCLAANIFYSWAACAIHSFPHSRLRHYFRKKKAHL